MAQSGFTPISTYYTTTASATPTAGNLVNGELAINITDGKLFYKDNAGVVQTIAGKAGAGVAGGSNTQVQYNSSGSLAGSSNFDTTTNQANQFFKQLYAKNKIIINKNDPSYDEVDINMQAPGLVVINNDRFAGNIFVYYKLPSGDLVVREVTPGGLVANPIKIGD